MKREYHNGKSMQKKVKEGMVWVSRWLDDSCSGKIEINEILASDNLEELQEMAQNEKDKVSLYRTWNKIYEKENN